MTKYFSKAMFLLVAVLITATILQSLSMVNVFAANASPLVKLYMGSDVKIYGLTAENSLGKKTGTLEEFARAGRNRIRISSAGKR